MEDVVIVGGGIIGAATSYYLRKRGVSATIIEKCRVACHSSGKAGGFLAKEWCDSSKAGRLAHMSFALHAAIRSESSNNSRDLGYRNVDVVQGDESLGTPENCAQVHPLLLTEYLVGDTEVVCGDVVGVISQDGRVTAVTLADGTQRSCSTVSFCLGAWSHKLAKIFPENSFPSKTWDGGHNHVVLNNVSLPAEMIFTECGSFEVYPRPDNKVYVCSDKRDPVSVLPDNPDDLQPTDKDVSEMVEKATRLRGAIAKGNIASSGLCCLPIYKGRDPCIGPVKGTTNCFMSCGHSCWGILNGPGTGKVLADLIIDGKTDEIDLNDFRP